MLSPQVVFFALSPIALSPVALAAGAAPTAEAGLGLLAYVEDTVELNGSGSIDPEGDALSYTWSQVAGPPVELQGGSSAQPRFTVTDPGALRFALVVNDGLSDSAADTVDVVVPYRTVDDVATGCAVVTAVPWVAFAGVLACLGRRRA